MRAILGARDKIVPGLDGLPSLCRKVVARGNIFRTTIRDLQMSENPPSAVFTSDLEEPIRAELFSLERLEQHAESLAAAQTMTANRAGPPLLTPRVKENGRVLLESYRVIAGPFRRSTRLPPPPNGWSTTSTLSTSSFARFGTICPPATTESCPNSPRVTCRAIPESSELRGRLSPTPTADLIPKCCSVL